MKILENKTTGIKKNESEMTTYAHLLKAVNDFTPTKGWSKSSLKSSFNIDEAIAIANGKIELEDADTEYIKGALRAYPWAIKHKDVLAFIEDVENMK